MRHEAEGTIILVFDSRHLLLRRSRVDVSLLLSKREDVSGILHESVTVKGLILGLTDFLLIFDLYLVHFCSRRTLFQEFRTDYDVKIKVQIIDW